MRFLTGVHNGGLGTFASNGVQGLEVRSMKPQTFFNLDIERDDVGELSTVE